VRNQGVTTKPNNRSHLLVYWYPSYRYRVVTKLQRSVQWQTPPVLFLAKRLTNHCRRADYPTRRYFENYGCFWSSVHQKLESCYQRRCLYRWKVPVEESGLSPRGGYREVTLQQGGPPRALCQSEPNPEHYELPELQTSTPSRQSLETHCRLKSHSDRPFHRDANVSTRAGTLGRDSDLTS
jgi:hypothetical protein